MPDLLLPGLQHGPQQPGNVSALWRLDDLVGMGQHKFCAVTALDVTQQRFADPDFEADVVWLLCHVRPPSSSSTMARGEVLDLLENETGMHSCLEPKTQASPVGAGGKRRHPRAHENTGIGADEPEAR